MSYLDVGKESEPYDLFIFAINAEQTREKYITRMKKFLEIIGIDQEKKLTIRERFKVLRDKAKSENEWLVNVIIQFLQYQKGRVSRKEITGSTLRNYLKVLKLFCEMTFWFHGRILRGDFLRPRTLQMTEFLDLTRSKKYLLIQIGR